MCPPGIGNNSSSAELSATQTTEARRDRSAPPTPGTDAHTIFLLPPPEPTNRETGTDGPVSPLTSRRSGDARKRPHLGPRPASDADPPPASTLGPLDGRLGHGPQPRITTHPFGPPHRRPNDSHPDTTEPGSSHREPGPTAARAHHHHSPGGGAFWRLQCSFQVISGIRAYINQTH